MMNPSLDAVRLTAVERQILGELKSVLQSSLGNRLRRAALFGSRARGDGGPQSDIDVAIVVDGLDRNLKREVFDLVAELELKHLRAISLLAFSTDQFDDLLERERRLAEDIVHEGIAL